MTTFLTILLVILMVLVVASLVRGVVAFLKSTKIDLESGEQTDATEMQLLQNKMMFARIKYQALAVVVVAVILVNGAKVEGTHTFTGFDSTVEYTMTELFKSPPPITEHGWNVDRMVVFVHMLMAVLFVGWTLYFLFCMYKFRESNHPKADYHGARSKFWTTLVEYGVIAAEVVLIVCFAIPLWAEVMNDEKLAEIKAKANGGGEKAVLSKPTWFT